MTDDNTDNKSPRPRARKNGFALIHLLVRLLELGREVFEMLGGL
ncbi:hypothetical protein AB6V29_15435 [Microbacterium sp. 20-116]